jgi:serine/threonine protein kinase
MPLRFLFDMKQIRTFQDDNKIYMLLELVQGGELWSLLYEKMKLVGKTKFGGFPAPAALFYAGCVTSALKYMHGKDVAYRDLKPENLLIDNEGYLKVVDFGFAKKIPYYKDGVLKNRSYTLCGTPEYLSPELVMNQGK